MSTTSPRGITLLIAVIFSTVVLSVALALLDVSYKQQVLASTAKQSQSAFYSADTLMECALYWDQKINAFDYFSPNTTITCGTQTVTLPIVTAVGNTKTTTFTVPCPAGGSTVLGTVTVVKTTGAATCSTTGTSCIYATGYSTCNAGDLRRIERGLKVIY